MALTWVRVDGNRKGDNVFADGDYVQAVGIVGTSFKVDSGAHSFETLGPSSTVVQRWKGTVNNVPSNSSSNPIVAVLKPV